MKIFVQNIKVAQNILFPLKFLILDPKVTPKGVLDGLGLPLMPVTGNSSVEIFSHIEIPIVPICVYRTRVVSFMENSFLLWMAPVTCA